jgi:hypothetical protein
MPGKKGGMWKRRRNPEGAAEPFPPELLAEARATPGGWVYSIDAGHAPDGAGGAVPFDGIIGGWRIAADGTPTGEYWANPDYRPNPPPQ